MQFEALRALVSQLVGRRMEEGGQAAAGGPACGSRGRGRLLAVALDESSSCEDVRFPVDEPGVNGRVDLSQVAAAGKTLMTNRGSEITESGQVGHRLHWLGLSVFGAVTDEVIAWVAGQLPGVQVEEGGEVMVEVEGGARLYRRRLVGPSGLAVLGEFKSQGRPHVLVQLPGQALDDMGGNVLAKNLMGIFEERGLEWRLHRVDSAFDGSPVSPLEFHRACLEGQLRTRLRLDLEEGERDEVMGFFSNRSGQTAYLGKRGGPWQVCCYNERGYNRLEARFKGKRAELLGRQLAVAPLEEWPGLCLAMLRNCVDLVDREGCSNVSRAPLLPMWSALVGGVAKCTIRLADVGKRMFEGAVRQVLTLQSRMAHLAREAAKLPSFALEVVVQRVAALQGVQLLKASRSAAERSVEALRDLMGKASPGEVVSAPVREFLQLFGVGVPELEALT